MNEVLITVYHSLPPPRFPGSDLSFDGRGEFVLSKLPLSIQWEIVRRLSVKDAVRLSVLSRYWYNFLLSDPRATNDSTAPERRTTPDPCCRNLQWVSSLILCSKHWCLLRMQLAWRSPLSETPFTTKEVSSAGRNLNLDRITFLPDCVRCKIVACLPIRDAVRKMILSRRWCYIWSSTPLHLDNGHLLRSMEHERVKHVSKLFIEHPGPFSSIRLCFTCFDHHQDALGQWVSLLADKAVEDLILVNNPLPVNILLPCDILRCTSLRRLCLGFLRFPCTREHSRVIFRELREIGLHCVHIDSADFARLMRSSPMLNALCIVSSYGYPDVIHIHGHKNLQSIVLWTSAASELSLHNSNSVKRLIMWNNSGGASQMTLKIGNAPSLESLGYLESGYHNLVVNNVAIKAGTKANPVVRSVSILGCKLSIGDTMQSKMLLSFLRFFPHVETLHIQSVEAVNPSGKPNLTSWSTKGNDIQCVDNHVKKLFFHNFLGERSELAFLKFVWGKAKFLEKMVILLSAQALDRKDETRLKLIEVGESKRASKEPRLLVLDFDIPMTFQTASNASVKDPFFSLDHYELSHDDQEEEEEEEVVGMVTLVVELSSGRMMPVVGLVMGPRGFPMDKPMIRAFVSSALQIGYRHFDLSGDIGLAVEFSDALAEACRNGTVKREDLYISATIYCDFHSDVIEACRRNLEILQMDYIDLGLIECQTTTGCQGFWNQVEHVVSRGLVRDIGLSNWNITQIQECLPKKIKLVVNQFSTNPYLQCDPPVNFCKNMDMYVMTPPIGCFASMQGSCH
ncbi:hypothetical protein C2845_PM11G11950 [Panicum miliaceum]|uniref:F-box domain-containing protein n=1 Tax=Panicum miliaceum TaxID=4540 RepID=A0A3L6RS03_PANMI|nr:hypothetical protein C2845_PM11G11950 [Panicum miliaceum]